MGKNPLYIGSNIYRRSAFGHNHPLAYARQESVLDMCRILGWLPDRAFVQSLIADYNTLIRYHDPVYVSALKRADFRGKASREERGKFQFGTMENPLFNGVFRRASTTVGGSIEAAKRALNGHVAFHPSGGTHHGLKDHAHGFCYFNDPVFAILTFLDAGLSRVAYVDIDAHHGDGVELAFAKDERVCFISVHEDNRWPHTGTIADQSPNQLNIPVPFGINDSEYRHVIDQLVLPKLAAFAPQAVVITCGADGLLDDPLSKMGLSNIELWRTVDEILAQAPRGVVLGGGGYNPWTTIRCWVGLWGHLSGQDMPKILPEDARAILDPLDSDLIDEEDRDPHWFTRLDDDPNLGDIRPEIERLTKILA